MEEERRGRGPPKNNKKQLSLQEGRQVGNQGGGPVRAAWEGRGACQEGKRHSLQLRINKEAMEINRMLIRVIIVLEFSFSSVYILF